MITDAKAATAAWTESTEVKAEKRDEQDDDEQVVVIRDAECEDEEDLDDKEDDGEVVWDPEWDGERRAEAWAAQDRLAVAVANACTAALLQTRGYEAQEMDRGDQACTLR